MAKSEHAEAVDAIQRSLRPLLREAGFRVRGRTFNRTTEDGLTQVVNLQMGASDPPGTTDIPGLRENLHGRFTVNLGVYVPEVARHHGGGEAKSWVQEYYCCVRARLGEACGEDEDLWWAARDERPVVEDVLRRLKLGGLPWLRRFESRDKIIAEWSGASRTAGASESPRIVLAIVQAERGEKLAAAELLARQAAEAARPVHAEYVRELAGRLGLGPLD